MTTGATGQLGLALPVQGELSGTWGDTVNNGITQYTNIAIAATLTLTNDGAVTLANTTGDATASNITSSLTGAGTVTAQFAIVRVTGTLTAAKVITAPSYSKTYVVVNAATGGIVTFKASGQTGVSIAVGESAWVYYNGTDYVKIAGTAAGAAGGSNTQVQYNSSGALAGDADLTFDGTTLSTAGLTASGTVTLSGGTANGVTYLNGSKVLTSGSALVFDGTNLGIGAAASLYFSGSNKGLAIAGTSNGAEIDLKRSGGTGTSYIVQTAADSLVIGNQSSSPIAFYLSDTEQMRLTSTGLGIGTSSPAYKLDVLGSSYIVGRFLRNGTTTASGGVQVGNNSQVFTMYGDSTGLSFENTTSSTTPLILNTSGNLGLGVTPSGKSKFEVYTSGGSLNGVQVQYNAINAPISFATDNSNGDGYIGFNTVQVSGATQNYVVSNYATKLRMEAGAFKFYNAPSGTAGNAITFTQAMTLDASGRLSVGGTTASANAISAFGVTQVLDSNGNIFAGSTDSYAADKGGQIMMGGKYRGAGDYTAFGGFAAKKENGTDGNFAGYLQFLVSANGSGNLERARISSAGGFSVGTTADPGAGAIYATGNITAYYSSDIKFKENVRDIPDALATVNAIGGKLFDWTDEYIESKGGADGYFVQKADFGVVAQDVQKVFPIAVRTREDGSLAVDYEKLSALAMASIVELTTLVQTLSARVEALEAK